MRKIALIAFLSLLLSLPMFAGFFPKVVHTSIKSVEGDSFTLKKKLPIVGMSAVVVHDYGNDLHAITAHVVQNANNASVSLVSRDILHHDELPTIKTAIIPGDKIIAGYMYSNVLLFAPDADTYAKITSSYNKKWIHPDLFALYLANVGDTRPTKENLFHFSKKYQVGLICIVRNNNVVLMDPISGKVIASKGMKNLPKKGRYPFYMRFEKIEAGWFSQDVIDDYYTIMNTL